MTLMHWQVDNYVGIQFFDWFLAFLFKVIEMISLIKEDVRESLFNF